MRVKDRFRAMLRTWLTKEELDRFDSLEKGVAGVNLLAIVIYNTRTTNTNCELDPSGQQ